jgi:nucleoside-diphosphate-sugar epimerase
MTAATPTPGAGNSRVRVAILGANGQVGAELCLLLSNHPHLDLVPISRNASGSAFLRYCGIPVRHGAPADPTQAPRLLGDCDLVVNLALGAGTPRQIRETERLLTDHAARFSKPGARQVFFSTFSVYGDVRRTSRVRWNSNYGRTKLASEKAAADAAARAGKEIFVFRLGHVTGELQRITGILRDHIRAGPVVVPQSDPISNTVATVTIADAILKVAAGGQTPGVYDLMNHPQWTWRQVLEHEARRAAVPLDLQFVPDPAAPKSIGSTFRHPVGAAMGLLRRNALAKQFGARIAAHLPASLNRAGHARWAVSRARSELAPLLARPITLEIFDWIAPARRFMPGLEETARLVDAPLYSIPPRDAARAFPPDLPPAV